jgi:hypothetical protein
MFCYSPIDCKPPQCALRRGAAYTLANQLLGACPLRHGFEGTY